MFGVGLLQAILPLFVEQPPSPFQQLYERIMADLHITVNTNLVRQYLKTLGSAAASLFDELDWVPRMLDKSSSEYSEAVSFTYELMAQHDCAGISYRIRTAYRASTINMKGEWAEAVLSLAEIVAALVAPYCATMLSKWA